MPTASPSEPLAVALFNSVKSSHQPPVDLLAPVGAVERFWRRQAESNEGVVSLALEDTRELRWLVTELLTALCRGQVPTGAVLDAANRLLGAAPERLELVAGVGEGSPLVAWRSAADGTPEGTRAEAIRSAVELLPRAAEGRLRECAAADCSHIFIATNAKRQWCQERCGNRVRVARHAARIRHA
jgi:predicted RNA-binding Zn ribbon-like protein